MHVAWRNRAFKRSSDQCKYMYGIHTVSWDMGRVRSVYTDRQYISTSLQCCMMRGVSRPDRQGTATQCAVHAES